MKIIPPPQEECMNVKPSNFKHTFKEPTARNFQYLEYVIVTCHCNLDDCVIHVVRWAAYHASKH